MIFINFIKKIILNGWISCEIVFDSFKLELMINIITELFKSEVPSYLSMLFNKKKLTKKAVVMIAKRYPTKFGEHLKQIESEVTLLLQISNLLQNIICRHVRANWMNADCSSQARAKSVISIKNILSLLPYALDSTVVGNGELVPRSRLRSDLIELVFDCVADSNGVHHDSVFLFQAL